MNYRFKMNLKILAITILLAGSLFSQENFLDFRVAKEGYYHYISQPDVKNFSCLISSSIYINFIKDKADSNYYYPLKIVWTRQGDVYYIMQPFPDNLPENQLQAVVAEVKKLKQVFTGVLLDWEQFCLFSPFKNIPDSADVKFNEDTVGVTFTTVKDERAVRIKKIFGLGGKLLQVIWQSGDLRIVTTPAYDEVNNKWLCYGWDGQVYYRGEIASALSVGLELVNLENLWLPTRFDILAQSSKEPDQKKLSSIYFKNYIINEDFEIVPPPPDAPKGQP
ncbi:MAG: hypothetical protein ACE5GL_05265 [Calditrichia bacterium]